MVIIHNGDVSPKSHSVNLYAVVEVNNPAIMNNDW